MLSLLILFFCISIVFSFLCSMWEAVLLSITPTFASIQMQEGSAVGRMIKHFKDNIDQPLSAILTLNTIAHTVGAIGVGAQATKIWAQSSPWITRFVVPAAMTLAILILSEIIPKTIGANHWKRLSPFTVHSLRVIIFVLKPLVRLSQLITGMLKKDRSKSVFTRTEFAAMAEIGAQQGVFARDESEIINNLLRFHEVLARDIMTPRTVVKAVPEEMTLAAFNAANPNLRFSRIPVYESDSKDQITGYVLKDEVLSRLIAQGGDILIREIKREIVAVAKSFPIPDLFTRFIQEREHIALVVDDFGGTSGIVTMEDVIETLLGFEIVDEMDGTDDMQVLARKNWERRARALGLIEAPPADVGRRGDDTD